MNGPTPRRTRALPALLSTVACACWAGCSRAPTPELVSDPAAWVDPLIGTANGGNTVPGAVVPFGMVQWSPETTRGDATRRPAPGGYQYDATRVRGFSLTHLSGTGCRGASGDVPFLPWTDSVRTSPSADAQDRVYSVRFSHPNEDASAGFYSVRLASGVLVELSATTRTGSGRFTFPPGASSAILIRTSDSEVGSSEAHTVVDPGARTVSGRVSSGNFCGYIDPVTRHSYYTLYFVAAFDRPFSETGGWSDATLRPGALEASGGTTYDTDGYPAPGRGSGVWVGFDTSDGAAVNVRVGISYVGPDEARANLEAESPEGTTLEATRAGAREAWNRRLGQIRVGGGTPERLRTFYTALYHSLLHPNVFSDADGRYAGFDGRVHEVADGQEAQYANFSGWDVYRSQVQLLALLDRGVASDIAQSLYQQAEQNGGVWDRWTHNTGATHVMEGDASTAAVAAMHAFGADAFDVAGAYASLLRAARVPSALDSSDVGCPVMCPGQRPSLDAWLSLHYIPADGNAWGGAGETLEDAIADFGLAQMAGRLGDGAAHRELLERSGYWRNLFNPEATPERGYIQDRNADGSWTELAPASSRGFAEGSSAQYTWMVPHDVRGLFDAMGGAAAAVERLDDFFRTPDGGWALTGLGGMHAEMDNEPSVGTPFLYLFARRPDRAQETIREVLDRLWSDRPHGIPGNDDLGEMSSWYVWTALGLYPAIPGRADLLVGTPLFPVAEVRRASGPVIRVEAPGADTLTYVRDLQVDGRASTRSWLPESFVATGGTLRFALGAVADTLWGRGAGDVPPSYPPPGG